MLTAGRLLAAVPGQCHQLIGHRNGCGFPAPSTDDFDYANKNLFSLHLGSIDFQFNKPVLLELIGVALVMALFLAAFSRPRLVPARGPRLQNIMESVYDFVGLGIARDVIGKEGQKFVPYLVTLFSFVLVVNVFEIIPVAQFPASSRIAIPIYLALISFLIFNYVGIRRKGLIAYFREIVLPPNVPWPLYIILSPIEFFSTIVVRPFTLAVRLFANMFAGHLLLLTFTVATTYLLQPNIQALFGGISFLLTIVLIGFELLVDVLQAYIFTILTAVYISGALAEEH